jgi:23S rRNA (uracil1939-C5)-methyltransferase
MSTSLLVTIELILPGGVGLAHADGKTVFVSLAAAGDRARVRVDREQNLLFASIVEIIEPSPERIEPPCPYFGRCGAAIFSS